MRGHIRKRGVKYEILLYEKYVNGTRDYSFHSGYESKKEAEDALLDILNDHRQGIRVPKNKMTTAQYLDRWLADYVAHNVTGGTESKYKPAADLAKKIIGDIPLQKLGPLDIQHYVNEIKTYEKKDKATGKMIEKERAKSTIVSYYNALKSAFNVAVKWQLIARNPCVNVIIPSVKKKPMVTYSKEEIKILLEEVEDTVMFLPIFLVVNCGLRRGEVLGLTWKSIDLDNKVLRIQEAYTQSSRGVGMSELKTSGSYRAVDFSEAVKQELLMQKKFHEQLLEKKHGKVVDIKDMKKNMRDRKKELENTHVCTWEDGEPIRPGYVTSRYNEILVKLDFDHSRFHDLRHTHATLLLQAGVHPKVVQERLGHSKISITLDTYSHVIPSMQKEAAEMLNFS